MRWGFEDIGEADPAPPCPMESPSGFWGRQAPGSGVLLEAPAGPSFLQVSSHRDGSKLKSVPRCTEMYSYRENNAQNTLLPFSLTKII